MPDLILLLNQTGNGLCRSFTKTTRLGNAGLLAMMIIAATTLPTAAAELGPVMEWAQVPTDPSSTPAARVYHDMVYDSFRNVVLMHSGFAGPDNVFGDTWAWDGQQWSLLSQEGPPGAIAFGLAFDSDRGVAVRYGGGTASGLMGQTWEWDGQQWQQIKHEAGPGPRAGCPMAYDPGRKRVVLHGGGRAYVVNSPLSDTWEWDGASWKEIPNAGGPQRVRHKMVYDARRKVMVLFGGLDGQASAPVDTWEFSGSQWKQVATEAGGPPGGRDVPVMAYDSARGVTIVSGGGEWGSPLSQYFGFVETRVFGDTWEWNGQVWSQAATEGAPPAVFGAAAAYDPRRGRMVHFGGTLDGTWSALNRETWEFGGADHSFMPVPAAGQTDVFRKVDLSWTASSAAGSHNVYFGTSWDAVHDANTANPLGVLASQGQSATTFDPGRLALSETYYWRVDEVSATPDKTVFRGIVWSFTVEAFSYPIANIIATASSSSAANMGPENTIDGSGLDALDQHGTTATDMWLSSASDQHPWIQYEFDKVYKLHEMWVWNSNQMIESFLGLGAKDVVIETSIDGAEWTAVEDVTQFNQGTGTQNYTHNTTISLGSALAKYVRITINTGYGMLAQYGLSEVRFFSIPTYAREPVPAVGTITEGADIMLSWRAGHEAASHQVYFGRDAENLTLLGTTTESTFTIGALDYTQTYYWSVAEVNEAETPSSYAGDIWSFTTPDYGVVDDFDQYDNQCNRIFFAWEDGFGHNGVEDCDMPPSNGNGGGSIVGHAQAPFAERTIANVGSQQSMPLSYDNSLGPSETTLTLAGQDWTASGVQTLSLFFYGQPDNSGQLYVKINNAKVVYDGDAADISQAQWQQWNIDLTALDGLQNVTKLTIGVDGASTAGMLYIDDIRLYP